MDVDFPSDRSGFKEHFGYDFPYDSDEEPESIDSLYGNAGRKLGGSLHSYGTGSDLPIAKAQLRLPSSSDNLAEEGEDDEENHRQRRLSKLSSSYVSASAPLDVSVISDGDDENLMDSFLKSLEGRKSNATTDLHSSTNGDSRPSVAEKSNAESTFFLANISTSDEGTGRISRERIIIPTNNFLNHTLQHGEVIQIPTKFPMENSDIDLKMMADDKSVRSALTCDQSYAFEQSMKDRNEEEKSQSTHNELGDLRRVKTRSASPASTKKSTASSHYGSFMAWPDSEDTGETTEEEEQEEKETTKEGEGELCLSNNSQPSEGGSIVCGFPTDNTAFRAARRRSHGSELESFHSTSSKATTTTSQSRPELVRNASERSTDSKASSNSGRHLGNTDARRKSLRGSLDTIDSNKPLNKSLKRKMRASLSDSIERRHARQSFRDSIEPKPNLLTELLDEQQAALPLVGWDDNNSDCSSLLSSSSRKLTPSVVNDMGRPTSLSITDTGGGSFFCDDWVTRSSFKKRGDNPTDKGFVTVRMPIEEEFDSKKPWMKGPPVAVAQPALRRGSAVSLDLSTRSQNDDPHDHLILKKDPPLNKGIMRASFTSATSSLGDDNSLCSDITELRQAQEALFSLQENHAEESDDPSEDQSESLDASENSYNKFLATIPDTEDEEEVEVQPPSKYPLESVKEESEREIHMSPSSESEDLDRSEDSDESGDKFEAELNQSMTRPKCRKPKNMGLDGLDELEADISASHRSLPVRQDNDSDTFSDLADVSAEPEKNTHSLGVVMSVVDHDIEREFDTKEMEEVDFSNKEQDFDEPDDDLEVFLESTRNKRRSLDMSSHTGGVSSRKGSSGRSGKVKLISDKMKPIKDRLKKKSGSNHVRRRHKRLWKFCVWNCRKITILVVLVLFVFAGISTLTWYGLSKGGSKGEDDILDDDEVSEDSSMNHQWPPVGDTNRNPLQDDTPTTAPSTHNNISISDTLVSANSSSPLHQSSIAPSFTLNVPSAQPTIVSSQNLTLAPSRMTNSTSPTHTPSSIDATTQSPSLVNNTLSPNVNESYVPTPSPFMNTTLNPSYTSISPSNTESSLSSLSPNINETYNPSTNPFSNTDDPSRLPTSSPSTVFSSFEHLQIIAGDDEFQHAGSSVSMSPTGEYVAIGMKEAHETGMVRVYVRDGEYFVPFGVDSMFGESPEEEFGSAVSISDDGKRVAVGARSSSLSGKDKNGYVKVYRYSESLDSWLQVGDAIVGSEDLERLGFAVDISGDGLRVACGSPKGSGGLGSVGVYDFTRAGWSIVGDVLVGEEIKDMAGFSLSLSSDGSVVAVGALTASLNGLTRCGTVTIYSLNKASVTWKKSGQVLAGANEKSQFGYSLALSGDGLRIAVGSNGYSTEDLKNIGSCEIFELDKQTSRWKQIGAVYGDADNEEAGYHVSMSKNGKWIACSKTIDSSGNREGGVVISTEDYNEWISVETITSYFGNSTSFGTSTSLSKDGRAIIVGAPSFNSSTGFAELLTRSD